MLDRKGKHIDETNHDLVPPCRKEANKKSKLRRHTFDDPFIDPGPSKGSHAGGWNGHHWSVHA